MRQRKFNLITRDQWKARKPKYRYQMNLPANDTWVHHTVAAFPRSPNWTERAFKQAAKRYMREIQNFHMDTRGWSDIAYSFIVFKAFFGRYWVFEGRGWGAVGGHTEGHNSTSHGIAYAGNASVDKIGEGVVKTFGKLIADGIRRGYVAGHRNQPSGGHRDTKATECPGNNLYAALKAIRKDVQRRRG